MCCSPWEFRKHKVPGETSTNTHIWRFQGVNQNRQKHKTDLKKSEAGKWGREQTTPNTKEPRKDTRGGPHRHARLRTIDTVDCHGEKRIGTLFLADFNEAQPSRAKRRRNCPHGLLHTSRFIKYIQSPNQLVDFVRVDRQTNVLTLYLPRKWSSQG